MELENEDATSRKKWREAVYEIARVLRCIRSLLFAKERPDNNNLMAL